MPFTFTEAEKSLLLQAPAQAIAAVTLADRVDPISFLKEVEAGVGILANEVQRQDIEGELIQSLVGSMRELDQQDALQGEQLKLKKTFEILGYLQTLKNSAEGQERAVEHFKQVATVLTAKATGLEANAFKQWLLLFAKQVAEAAKEGGFLGIGGSRISEKESDILKKLADALGLERL